ncbi:MAG: hypothetical protein ABR949_07320 [Candidatus Aquilonibacter sp.]|jgi:hypothetical protein
MLVSVALAAAVAMPAGGTYTYQIATPGAAFTSTIVVAPSADGLRTHETFGTAAQLVETDQQFDGDLAQRSFAASQNGKTLTIDVSPTTAHYAIEGNSADAELGHPACTLIDDNILTESLMLPAIEKATHATQCTYVLSTSPHAIIADVTTTTPAAHPVQAAASDLALTIHFGSVTEIVWYDPTSLIPDYLDFGNAQSATLTGRSPSTAIPTAAPSATP